MMQTCTRDAHAQPASRRDAARHAGEVQACASVASGGQGWPVGWWKSGWRRGAWWRSVDRTRCGEGKSKDAGRCCACCVWERKRRGARGAQGLRVQVDETCARRAGPQTGVVTVFVARALSSVVGGRARVGGGRPSAKWTGRGGLRRAAVGSGASNHASNGISSWRGRERREHEEVSSRGAPHAAAPRRRGTAPPRGRWRGRDRPMRGLWRARRRIARIGGRGRSALRGGAGPPDAQARQKSARAGSSAATHEQAAQPRPQRSVQQRPWRVHAARPPDGGVWR